jgi:hypothetical protein
MKLVKIIFGILAGIFGLMHCVYLPTLILRGATFNQILGSAAGLLIGAAISIALFKSAFTKKPNSSSEHVK